MPPRYIFIAFITIASLATATSPAKSADEIPAADQQPASTQKSGQASSADPKASSDQKTPAAEKQLTTINPVGKPKYMATPKRHDYYVWYADGWWHIRGSDKSKQSVFYQGSVELDGGEILETNRPELDNRKNKKIRDWAVVDRDKKGLKFLFRNNGGADSVGFRVTEGTKTIKFGLGIDRDHSPDNVRIGPSKKHPLTNPFILPAFPEGKPPADHEKTEEQ